MGGSQPSRLTQTRSEKKVSVSSTQRTSGLTVKGSPSYVTSRPTGLMQRGGESPRHSFEEEGEKRQNLPLDGQLLHQAISPANTSNESCRSLEQVCPSWPSVHSERTEAEIQSV